MQNRNKRTEQNLCESTVCIALQYATCNVKESIKTHSLACSWVWFTPTVEPGGKESRTPLSTWAVDSLVTLDRIAKALGYCFVAAQRGFKSVELMSMRCMDACCTMNRLESQVIHRVHQRNRQFGLASKSTSQFACPSASVSYRRFRRISETLISEVLSQWMSFCTTRFKQAGFEPGFAGLLCAQKQFLTAWEVKEMLEMLLVQRCALVTSSFADLHGFHCQSFARSQEISCL